MRYVLAVLFFWGSTILFAQENSLYPISNADELSSLRQTSNLSGKQFVLSNHIFLNASGNTSSWTPIGNDTHPFSGDLSGGGYFIYGLNVTDQPCAGLFHTLSDASIGRLTFINSHLHTHMNDAPAAVVSCYSRHSNITEITALKTYAITEGDHSVVSGVVGRADEQTRIQQTFIAGSLSSSGQDAYAGGTLGEGVYTKVEETVNAADLYTSGPTAHAGGGIGRSNGKIRLLRSLNTGTIVASGSGASVSPSVGQAVFSEIGIVLNTANLTATGSRGKVSGGFGNGWEIQCHEAINTGTLSLQNGNRIGGISADLADADINTVMNFGDIYATAYNTEAAGILTNMLTTGNYYEFIDPDPLTSEIVGRERHTSVLLALNAGNIRLEAMSGQAGGIFVNSMVVNFTGSPSTTVNITQTLNTGKVVAAGGSHLVDFTSSAFAEKVTAQYNYWVLPKSGAGYTPANSLKNTTQLEGFNQQQWRYGNAHQYPMLKKLDPLVQDLFRMGADFNVNKSEYAFPEKNSSQSMFISGLWRLIDGTKPFLNVSDEATLAAQEMGIDIGIPCGKDGFACTPWMPPTTEPATTEPATTEPATTEPATTEPATTETATTEPATTEVFIIPTSETTSEPPSMTNSPDVCKPVEGQAIFQAYDADTQSIYGVVYTETEPEQLQLVHYLSDGGLDSTFGNCGVLSYRIPIHFAQDNISAGLWHTIKGNHAIYLPLVTDESFSILQLPLPEMNTVMESSMNAELLESYLGSGIVRDIKAQQYSVFFGGLIQSILLLGRYSIDDGGYVLSPLSAGEVYTLLPEKDTVFVAGQINQQAMMQRYNASTLMLDTGFGMNGVVTPVSGPNSTNSVGKALAIHDGLVYIAIASEDSKDLLVYRYGKNGIKDDSFEISVNTGEKSLSARVTLLVKDNFVRVIKQVEKVGEVGEVGEVEEVESQQLFIGTYDKTGHSYDEFLWDSGLTKIALYGEADNENNQYFIGTQPDGTLKLVSIPLPVMPFTETTNTGYKSINWENVRKNAFWAIGVTGGCLSFSAFLYCHIALLANYALYRRKEIESPP